MNRRHLRWIVPAATAVLATVVAVVLATQVGGSAACAAGGQASYYTAGRNGMCNLGTPAEGAYAAVGRAEYAGGKGCGTYLDVTGPNGTTRVQVVDLCPSCPAGKVDLGKAAFARIGALSAGIIPVTYATVRDPQVGPLQVKLKGGTAYSSLTAIVNNHGNPLSAVELQTATGFTTMRHGEDNTWTAPSGAVPSPVSLRISDIYGHQATVSGLALGKNDFQPSQTVLYGGPSPSPSTVESSSAPSSPPSSPSPSLPPPTC
ncbi:expansin EXLX1 family cellulose-binding protein [Dactylosporangium darangshiense]|uniref:RlpA-like protein double-psi beta-barrel domain-containing protein n=1 Tax=Dactylosporangium darangshiense TaxID=579108 RepID=A0ABP8DKS2_9ACTN